MNLDTYDYKCLRLFKQESITDDFHKLWAERCATTQRSLKYWAQHWLNLNEEYHWFSTNKLVEEMAPLDYFIGKAYTVYGNPNGYWDNAFSAIASILRLTEVSKFPGYREWIDLHSSKKIVKIARDITPVELGKKLNIKTLIVLKMLQDKASIMATAHQPIRFEDAALICESLGYDVMFMDDAEAIDQQMAG